MKKNMELKIVEEYKLSIRISCSLDLGDFSLEHFSATIKSIFCWIIHDVTSI